MIRFKNTDKTAVYSTVDGTNTKLYLFNHLEDLNIHMPQIHLIEWSIRDHDSPVKGNLEILITTAGSPWKIMKNVSTMTLKYTSDYDKSVQIVFNDVKFLNQRCGVAVDDIVIVEKIDFTANTEGWLPLK